MNGIGKGIDRVDGRLKVTGGAVYSAEHNLPRQAYGYLIVGTIPNGRITGFDIAAAQGMPGVISIITPANAPRLPKQEAPPPGVQRNPHLSLLQDDRVQYNGQPIAIVVADTFEQARAAARRISVHYAPTDAALNFKTAQQHLRKAPSQPE